MKKIILLVLLTTLTEVALSQWAWQNPLPQGNPLTALKVIDASTIIAFGWNGTIVRSSDGGTTWNCIPSGTRKSFHSVCFPDANTGYIGGEGGVILKTIDGGLTWVHQTSGTNYAIKSVLFLDSSNGYAVTGSGQTILKTTDGGDTWIAKSLGTYSTPISGFFLNIDTGFVIGTNGTILKTTNGGSSWTALPSGTFYEMRSVCFTDATTGYIAGGFGDLGIILKTTDSGATWNTVLTDIPNLRTIYFRDDHIGFAVGDSGTMLKTTDGGATWTTVACGTTYRIWSLEFSGTTIGYTVGDYGTILKTQDGALTWSELSSAITNNSIWSVHFPSSTTGYAVGLNFPDDQGVIIKTVDAGNTWSSIPCGLTLQLYSVFFIDTVTGYVVGDSGIILKTNNGGNSWAVLPSGTTMKLYSVFFENENTGYAVGGFSNENGTILKTLDAGMTWNVLLDGLPYCLFSVFFTNENRGFAVGGSHSYMGYPTGKILRTVDGGLSWTVLSVETTRTLRSVYFPDALTGYAVGSGVAGPPWGSVLKTSDGGITWSELPFGDQLFLTSVFFPNKNTGYLAGFVSSYASGTILKTVDGGLSWSDMPAGVPTEFTSIFFTNTHTGYAVGSYGTVMKYDTVCFTGDAGLISGPDQICQGTGGYIYTVAPIPNANTYNWSLPFGGVITSGAGTNTITVSYGYDAEPGLVTVFGSGDCDGNSSQLPVSVSPPPSPTINGSDSLCLNTGYYSYETESGMNGYQWTVSPGGSILNGSGTDSILISWDSAGTQQVSCNYSNANGCSAQTPTLLIVMVDSLPGVTGIIIGMPSVCAGDSGVEFSVDPVQNAMAYAWYFPPGAEIVAGQYTNSVTVQFSTDASSGSIIAMGNNLCGNGPPSPEFLLTVNPIPATPYITEHGDTLFSSSPIGNQWYYNGLSLFNDTNQFLVLDPSFSGYYWTQVSIDGCTSDTSNHFYYLSVGVVSPALPEFRIYPNPASDHITLETHSAGLLSILDVSGQKLLTQEMITTSTTIDVSILPSGIYIVKIVGENGVQVGNFIKQ